LAFWYAEDLIPQAVSRLFLLFSAATLAAAQPSALLDAMSQELSRNFLALKDKADPPPYFLSYEVTEMRGQSLSASLGALESDNDGMNRSLDTSVRVGTPKLDNYHRVRSAGGASSGRFTSGITIPF
jgi:TldD protein